MKKVMLLVFFMSFVANANTVALSQNCSFGVPISSVYQRADALWVIQVYGGIMSPGGYDLLVNHDQLMFKGVKGTKSLSDYKIGWAVEDKGFGGVGNEFGQCDYTVTNGPVYVIKR